MKALVGLNLSTARFGASFIHTASLLAIPAFLLLVAGCSSTTPLQSTRASSPLFIDGELTEWSGSMAKLGSQPISVGIRHDDEYVYVSLQTMDEMMLRRIMLGGLTVWFNSEGNHSRETGIRFPLGLASAETARIDPDRPATTAPDRPQTFSQLELVNKLGFAARWPVDGVPGITVKSYLEYGSFSYELKIPMERGPDHEIAVSPNAEGVFGLGVETGAVADNSLGRTSTQGSDAPAPSSGGGGRGGRRSAPVGVGTSNRGTISSALEPVVIWSSVSLSPAGVSGSSPQN